MEATPITDQLRAHLAQHPGDVVAVVDALEKVEALARSDGPELHDLVPEWP